MAFGTQIRTFFEGRWHDGDVAVMRAADHGIWQGSSVFDGARYFDGVCPDLGAALRPRQPLGRGADDHADPVAAEEIEAIAREGLRAYDAQIGGLYPADVLGAGRIGSGRRPAAGRDRLCALPGSGADAAAGRCHHPDPHPVPPPGAGGQRLQRQGGLPLPQQRPDAGRGAGQGLRQRAGGRCDGQRGGNCDGERVHRQGWRGVHPDRERHLPGGHHPRPPHRQPARRRGRGARSGAELRGCRTRRTRCSCRATSPRSRRSRPSTDRQYQVGPVTARARAAVLGLGASPPREACQPRRHAGDDAPAKGDHDAQVPRRAG